MATTDMTRYKKFVDFQDISGETVPTNDGAFFYKDSAFETNSKINVAGDVSSSANVYAAGDMVAQGAITGSGISSSGDIYAAGQMISNGVYSTERIRTVGFNAYIATTSDASGISTLGHQSKIYTQGNGSHIYTSGLNSHIYTQGSGGHIFTNGGADIKTINGGDISSSANIYAAEHMVVEGNIASRGLIRTVGAGGLIQAGDGGNIRTVGGGDISSSGDVYALGNMVADGAITGSGIHSSGDFSSGGNISSSANVYALGNMVADGEIKTISPVSRIYTAGDSSDIYTLGENSRIYTQGVNSVIYTQGSNANIFTNGGGSILTINGGDISSSANVYALGNMVADGAITGSAISSSGDIYAAEDLRVGLDLSVGRNVGVSGVIRTFANAGHIYTKGANAHISTWGGGHIYTQNGGSISTLNGGDISSSANVYAAQTIGVGKVADSGYAIDVANGLGDIRASAFVTYSDRNLKQNINPINNALEKVMKLEAVSYEMKGNQKQEIGFIAQDVAKIIPEICAIGDDGEGKGIDYSRLTSMLVGAIKAQQQQIEELKAIIKK